MDHGADLDTLMEIPLVEITPLVLEESARSFEVHSLDGSVHRSAGGDRGEAEPQNGETASESDASGEPRRRRRRSSASV
jgi:hypothetical protein